MQTRVERRKGIGALSRMLIRKDRVNYAALWRQDRPVVLFKALAFIPYESRGLIRKSKNDVR